MIVTKTGLHFPRPEWKLWRDKSIAQVHAQKPPQGVSVPCRATIRYWAGDRKRRDVPAILDAIWHVIERSGVLVDDSQIKEVDFIGRYSKENPCAEIVLMESEYSDEVSQ